MKGLLIKDFYTFGYYKRNFLLMLAMVLVLGFFLDGGYTFGTAMLTMYLLMVGATLFSLDERSGWDKTVLCLPYSRKRIVAGRYLFFVVMLVLVSVLGIGMGFGLAAVKGLGNVAGEIFAVAGVMAIIYLIANAIMIPVAYKFGAEKTRVAMMVIVLVPYMAGIMLMPKILPLLSGVTLTPALLGGLAAGAAALAVGLMAASYFISVAVYQKKEY